MAGPARKPGASSRARESAPVRLREDLGARLATAALGIAVLGTGLAVDPIAADSFAAPKRLIFLASVAVAAAALVCFPPAARSIIRAGRTAWVAPGLVILALSISGASMWNAPRPAASLDALRVILLAGLFLVIGASRVLDRGRGRWLAWALVAGCSVNSILALLQALDLYQPFEVVLIPGRYNTGALLGNEGALAQLLALCLIVAVTLATTERSPGGRGLAWSTVLLLLGGLFATRNRTALLALTGGTSVVIVGRLGRRGIAGLLTIGVSAALLAMVVTPLRLRLATVAGEVASGQLDGVLTNRLGPWLAAAEMIRERPLLGFGPGSFGAEFVSHRLGAEVRHRTRLVIPRLTSTFAEAHDEPLQAMAEIGLVGGSAVLLAALVVLGQLTRRCRKLSADGHPGAVEAVSLLALLVAGAIEALTWFPLQQPASALVILLAAGRAWRICFVERGQPNPDARPTPTPGWIGLRLAAVAALALFFAPEVARYRVERELARAEGAIRGLLAAMSRPGGLPASADPVKILDRIATSVAVLPGTPPGDSRGLILAGSARLVAGQSAAALALYRQAFQRGERAEIVLNAGRALGQAGAPERAREAYLRAGWISPEILSALPEPQRSSLATELSALEARLTAGELAQPPRLPGELAPHDS